MKVNGIIIAALLSYLNAKHMSLFDRALAKYTEREDAER